MELKYVIDTMNELKRFCSNRTFMELKFISTMLSLRLFLRSNRTFMELKSDKASCLLSQQPVLIVPL